MSDDYLGGIFDRVLATPFTLRASDEERFGKKEGGASAPKNAAQKQYAFRREGRKLVELGRMAFEGPSSPTSGGGGGGGGDGGGGEGGAPATPGSLHRANSMLLDGLMSSDSYRLDNNFIAPEVRT